MIFICLYVFLARSDGGVHEKGDGALRDTYWSRRVSN